MKRVALALLLTLSFFIAVGTLPLAVFAAPGNGDLCTTDYVDTLVGSDGGYYYRSGTQTSLRYRPDGGTDTFSHENYSGPRKHYLIKPDDQANYYGYCVEQGVSFPDAQRYMGVGWKNDTYFSKLPDSVANGIMLATMFGRQSGKPVPVTGCNDDDWYWATQVIIWEYQQQLRISPTKIQSNGYVAANYFQSTLDGRPAEKCYIHILQSMASYEKIPSFASRTPADAPLLTLKWDSQDGRWRLTIEDTNHIGLPLTTDQTKMTIERNGSAYTIVATEPFGAETFEIKKNVALPAHELLIWGAASNNQAIATGTADPVSFFIRLRTEPPGTFELHKKSEDNEVEGFEFQLKDENGQISRFKTNEDGIVTTQLYPGKYEVVETQTQKYRTPAIQTIEILENQKTVLEVTNILKKGKIQIQKRVSDTIAKEAFGEEGAVFQLFPSKYPTYQEAPENLRDEITTDGTGVATSKELPLGDYTLRQSAAPNNITISEDISVSITDDNGLVVLPVENYLQKGKIRVLKTNNNQTALSGAVFSVRTAEDILKPDGTIRYREGHSIGTIVTDDEGVASTDWLYPGKYAVEEIVPPKGHQLSDNPVALVELSTGNHRETTFVKELAITNNATEEFPYTGDGPKKPGPARSAAALLMSAIGMAAMAFHMKARDKTLH